MISGPPIVTKSAVLLALAVLLTGCSQEEQTPWMRLQAAVPQLKVTADTPEAAVKSWWLVRDQQEQYSSTVCKELGGLYGPIRSARDGLAAGELLAMQAGRDACDPPSYARDIVNVEVESATRAHVIAQIRNTEPPTPGYVLDNDERGKKERGVRMQYLLERADQDQPWKIAQIYSSDRYCTVAPVDGWCPLYDSKKGSGNSYVFELAQ